MTFGLFIIMINLEDQIFIVSFEVWRGYNGHVYFSPIRVQPIEGDRAHRTQSRSKKATPIDTSHEQDALMLNQSHPQIEPSIDQQMKHLAVVESQSVPKREVQTADEPPVRYRHSMAQHRSILPHVKTTPTSKHLHKGLAYKEVRRMPGMRIERSANNSAFEKPLVTYDLTQAYLPYGENLVDKRSTQTSSITHKSPASKLNDLREMRKRIVKGNTRSRLSLANIHGRATMDSESMMIENSEVALPLCRGYTVLDTHSHVSSFISTSRHQRHTTLRNTPVVSTLFEHCTTKSAPNLSSFVESRSAVIELGLQCSTPATDQVPCADSH
jgi:hypothetical protein